MVAVRQADVVQTSVNQHSCTGLEYDSLTLQTKPNEKSTLLLIVTLCETI